MKQNLFNKLWLRVGMIVAIMTTALSGTVWAGEVVAYTLTPKTGSDNGYATSEDIEIEGITWNITGNATMVPWRIGGKNLQNVDRELYSKTAIADNITKIEVTHGAASSVTVNSWTVIVSKSPSFSNPVSTLTPTFTANSTTTITRPDGVDWSNCYYKFVYNVTIGNSNKYIAFSEAKFYKETGTTLTESDLSLSSTSLSFDLYNDNSAKTITCTTSSTGAITVSASEYVTTSVSGNTITVTPVKATPSPQTITVNQAADESYAAGSATFTVSITNSAPDYATLPFEWAGGASASLLALAGVTANGLGSDYAAGNAPYLVKFDSDGDYIQVKTDSQPGKVTIDVKMLGGSNASSITVQESEDGETFTEVQALTISGAQNDNLILETTNDFAATTRYVRLLFTKGSNVGVGAISIALPSNDPVISAENVSIEYNTTSGSIDYEIVHPVEGGTISASTEAEWLTFGTTGTAFTATVNNAASARTADVTLTYTYNNSQTVTKDITLTQGGNPEAPGTENNPYTVAQARAAIDAETGVTGVYATGIVSEIVTAYNSQYGNISYNISADGSTESDQLQAYRGKSYNGESFTSANDIQVGDVVVIYGNLKNHQGTYEFEAGNQLVSLHREKTDPTILVEDATIAFGQTYTIDSELIEGGDVTVSVSPEGFATVNGLTITPSKAGSATVTVSTAESNLYNAGSETFTLTVTQPAGQTTAPSASAGETIFYESFAECTGSITTFSNNDGQGTFTPDNADAWFTANPSGAGGAAKFGTGSKKGSAEATISVTSGVTYTLTFKAAPWASNTSTMSVVVTGGTISGLSTDAMTTGQWNDFSATITATSTTLGVEFSASNNRFFLDEVKIEAPASGAPTETYTIPSSGLGTYCSQYPIDLGELPDGVKAYAVTAKGESSVTLTEITGTIKGGVGFILEGSGDVTFTFANSSTEPTNLLVGTLAPEYLAEGTAYGLKSGVFQPNTAGTIKAHRAYLPASAGAVKALTLIFEDDATGITHTRIVTDEATIYDLTGRRLSQMQKGINIVNGKKILK